MNALAGLTLENLMAFLEKLKKCPYCNDKSIEDFPVFNCPAGHRLCKKCFFLTLNRSCVQCNPKETNVASATHVQKDITPLVLPSENKIKNYEHKFSYRPQECIGKFFNFFECEWIGIVQDMPVHFKRSHSRNWNNMSFKHEDQITADQHKDLQIFKRFSRYFAFYFKSKNDMTYFHVALLGSEEDAKKYCYEIEFFLPEDPVHMVMFRKYCMPSSTPLTEILEKEKCIVLSDALKTEYMQGNVLHYRFWLKQASHCLKKISKMEESMS